MPNPAPPSPLPNPSRSTPAAAAAAAPALDPSKAAEAAHFLQRIKLFSTLSNDDCQQVVKRMRRRDFPPATVIVREGAPGSSMFFITSGNVEVRKKDPNTNIDFLLTEMGPGQNFGEMSLLTGKPRTATVITLQPTTCAVLEQKDFHDLLLQYPKIGLALTTILAERVETASQQVGIEFINLAKMNFDPRVLSLVPQTMMLQHRMIPVAFANNRLPLAMVNPHNIRLRNSILGLAIKKGASDIHIEPMEKDVVVRFRLDGVLQVVQNLPKKVQLGLISRLKILSKLDISEKRLPQDGRISISMEGKPIDFRVSTVPAKWGEKICMRILDKSNTSLGLDKVVTHQPTLELIRELINQPYGIMYVTGPTGSGKTTTLYSALAEINEPGYNISTAEDPIEYDLGGVNQIQVNKDIQLDFARILRAFLRQDPDIILVGETRDKETAHIAVEAALTGHLVFTTLHTNSAAGSFTRLNEMGIEPFLISSSTIGVMAQRLARRLCKNCKEQMQAEDQVCEYMGLPPKSMVWKGRGCGECNGKGVKGRIGIYEVMKMNAELRQMVAKSALTEDIHKRALELGMLDLKKYAALLLLNGDTSVEEVLQVVSVQE